jgi:hypothetical protein
MPRQLIPPEPWWPQAADLMVRYSATSTAVGRKEADYFLGPTDRANTGC